MDKRKNDFIAQGTILAAAAIVVRLIGLVYRIPMTAVIGDEGNGLYSYAYSIYTILLLLSSYSLPLAVSKMVSAKVEFGQWKNVRRIFVCSLLFGLCVGTLFALIILVGAEFFTVTFYKSELAAIGLRMMAPTILIMAIVGVFRGFFQGLQTTKPTALSQLLEQVANAVGSVLFAYVLYHYGLGLQEKSQADGMAAAWGAAGGVIGTGIGAFTALLVLVFLFAKSRASLQKMIRSDKTGSRQSYSAIFRLLLSIAVPVILSTAVYNVIDLIDASLFSNGMSTSELASSSTRIWGAYTGKCLLLVHIPVSISSAMGVSLIPSLTAAYAVEKKHSGKKKESLKMIRSIMKFTSVVAFPCAVGLFVLADPIIKTLFPGDASQASEYLKAASIAVVLFSFSTITNSILQGIDRINLPVTHSAVSLVIHIPLCLILLYAAKLQIYAIIVGYIVFGLSMCILNLHALKKAIGYRMNLFGQFLMPALCAAVMGVCAWGIYTGLHMILGRSISMLASVAAAVIIYFVLIIKLGVMGKEEMRDLPMGNRLVRIAQKMKLMK